MIRRASKLSVALLYVIFCFLFFTRHIDGLTHEETKQKVEAAVKVTDKILDTMFERWKIREYPAFLSSVEMTETSWEVLRVKLQVKILKSLTAGGSTSKFVVSFLGSSVTAGHDSPFNQSFSELTRGFMKPAFDAIGIELEVINGAMGNNPCLPYDVCVKTFAGLEADIIHWEQV